MPTSLRSEDLEALRLHVASGSAMDHDEADPWLQHLTTELNSHTWMTISGGGEGIIRTNRGTRPGSSCFALLVRRVLRRRTELLPERQEPLLEWDGVLSFEPTRPDIAAATLPLAFGDMVWADDLATPMVADDPTLLPLKRQVKPAPWLTPLPSMLCSCLLALSKLLSFWPSVARAREPPGARHFAGGQLTPTAASPFSESTILPISFPLWILTGI